MAWPGNHHQVVAVARNIRKPLKLGYIMVKNRTQHELNHRLTLAEAQEQEMAFFKRHPAFNVLPDSHVGITSLARQLTRVLVSRIQSNLPAMKHELHEKVKREGGGRGHLGGWLAG